MIAAATSPLLLDLWRVLTYQVPYNTAVVLRGVTVLGIACGVIGTFLLLRKRSLVADAISHAALPGVCIGFLVAIWLGMDGRPLWILLLGAAAAGGLGMACLHVLTSLPRVKEDAAIGVVLSVFFAVGIVLLGLIQNMPVGQKAGLMSFIFGQAATMRAGDSVLITIVAVGVLALALTSFKEMRLLCFDAGFARGLGYSRLAMDGLLMLMVMTLTVIGLHAVGVLLMVALLIIPAAAARFWTDRLGAMAIIAAIIGGLGAYIGAASSAVMANLPTGAAIVIVCGLLFVASMAFGRKRGLAFELWRRMRLSRRVARQHLLRAMYECSEVMDDPGCGVTFEELLNRRRWSSSQLRRALRRGIRNGDISRGNGAYAFTGTGQRVAERIVRSHRLWEHYLTTHADIAPSHVDRAADDIEHVLGEKLVRELEATLVRSGGAGILPVPRSPHRLTLEVREP